jgi:hypothetical protein
VRCDPRISVVPDQVRTAGPQIVSLAALAGIRLDEAQVMVANATAGVGADGRWAAFESVIFAPRQNLKTEYLIARILAGLFIFREELIVFSAHRASTTTKVFRRLKRAIDRSPQLGARIARVSNRIGAEQIELVSGQSVEMVARSTSSGRGFTGDVVILDEAHELDSAQLEAILPMTVTRKNPQVLYALSTGNESTSHVGGLRARALAGGGGVCWLEWSMGEDEDPADRDVWARSNPALGVRIPWRALEKEFDALGSDGFAREHLGRSAWPSGASGTWAVVSEGDWLACAHHDATLPVPVPDTAAVASDFDPFAHWPAGVPPWVRTRGVPAGF